MICRQELSKLGLGGSCMLKALIYCDILGRTGFKGASHQTVHILLLCGVTVGILPLPGGRQHCVII